MKALIRILPIFYTAITSADEFSVTNNNDSGAGSLRQAILDANALTGADQVTFIDGLDDIVLTSGELVITDEVSIIGPNNGQTINGNRTSRIFAVNNPDAFLNLSNLNIIEGGRTSIADSSSNQHCEPNSAYGFGICTEGNLSLNFVTINMNGYAPFEIPNDIYGVGIYVGGDLVSQNSIISNNSIVTYGRAQGAGVYVKNDTVLTNTQISNNSCKAFDYCSGGGLYVQNGDLELRNSTLLSNRAESIKEKFNDESSSGAALIENGDLTMINSTISRNRAFINPGIRVANGNAEIYNSTIFNNPLSYFLRVGSGHGVNINGELEMHSSVVAGTTGFDVETTYYRDCISRSLNPASSHNFIGSDRIENRFHTCGIQNNVNNNIVGAGLDAGLQGSTSSNDCNVRAGSPGTSFCVQTIAPVPGSILIDAGANPLNLQSDQRGQGFPRAIIGLESNNSAITDIGAFEQLTLPFDGACFVPAPEPSHYPPETNLCFRGSASEIILENNHWIWQCAGQLGGIDQECTSDALPENLYTTGENGSVICAPNSVFLNQLVTCEAVPNVGFTLESWTGTCSTTEIESACTFVYDGTNLNVGANFVRRGLANPITVPSTSLITLLIISGLLVLVALTRNKSVL